MFKRKNSNSEKKSNPKKTKPQKLTRAEKKEKKRKRKEFKKNNKKQFEVEGGIGGDRTPDTKRDVKTIMFWFAGTFLIIIGIIGTTYKYFDYIDYQNSNTDKLGKELKFSKTNNAKVTLSEVWTDKDRNVTVIKLGYPRSTRNILSNKGTNYKLYMSTGGEKPDIKMAYGILGSEGDGYLFIKGKLSKKAYNIGIENKLALTTDTINGTTSTSPFTKQDEDNLESAISSTNEESDDDNSLFGNRKSEQKEKAKNKNDFIKFRINPYSESTKVYNGSFLTNGGDIDYSKVVAQTSVSKALDKIKKDIEKHKQQIEKLQTSKKEFESRIKKDKKNEDAKRSLDSIKQSIKEEEDTVSNLESQKAKFEEADFTRESFGDMQEKSTIY